MCGHISAVIITILFAAYCFSTFAWTTASINLRAYKTGNNHLLGGSAINHNYTV